MTTKIPGVPGTKRSTAGASSPAQTSLESPESPLPRGDISQGLAAVPLGTEGTPGRMDIARDLLRRKTVAEANWVQPISRLTETQCATRRQIDRANTAVLRRILSDHGWPGLTLVGPDAARAAWLIALHADDAEFQKHALGKLADAATRGEAEPAQWAHLYDRCCALSGIPQLYGTQFTYGPDGIQPYPITEPETLDRRRAQYGLEPYAEKTVSLYRHHAGVAV